MNREVILVRHPAVDESYRGVCYGASDVPLAAGAALDELVRELAKIRLTHLYHSDFTRCAAVAERLATVTGLSPHADSRLRERSFGEWEGRPWADIHAESGDAMLGMIEAPATWRPAGGETTFAMRDRVLAWYRELPGEGRIVAITHGGPIGALRGTLMGKDVKGWLELIPGYGEIVWLERAENTE